MLCLLLLLPSLLCSATGSVYNVTPDDHHYPSTTCHHCHNLQHYLLNAIKYLTSNTQLLFLPGLHHIHSDFIIQNVSNISLIGCATNRTTPDTVIQCNSSVGIVLSNITNLVVKCMSIINCTKRYIYYNQNLYYVVYTDLLIKHCYNVQLAHVKMFVESTSQRCALIAVNVLGNSEFTDLTSNGIRLVYNNQINRQEDDHKLLVEDYHIVADEDVSDNIVIVVSMDQISYKMELELYNSNFSYFKHKSILLARFTEQQACAIQIHHCTMTNINTYHNLFIFKMDDPNLNMVGEHHDIQFIDCNFAAINNVDDPFFSGTTATVLHVTHGSIHLKILNCIFYRNNFQAVE